MSRDPADVGFALAAFIALLVGLAWLSFLVWAIYSVVSWVTSQ